MKSSRISNISIRTYLFAAIIAVMVASMLPLTGFAASSASTKQVGFGLSTILKSENADEIAKGMTSKAFQAKTYISNVNTGNQPSLLTSFPTALAIADLSYGDLTARVVVEDEVVVNEVVVNEVVASVAETSTPTFTSLASFAQQVTNGNSGQVTGIYSENIFALSVVQQPSGQAGYVATSGNTATQFGMASGLGFLAHNYLSGSLFSYLYGGAPITVVYGDGHTRAYRVSQIRKFQALSPNSPYSDFVDLSSGSTLSASDLFYATYGVSGQLVLQTCISANGNSSWGRLFVIATPAG